MTKFSDKLDEYSKADWSSKPSLFAQTVKNYLPESGSILELGAGLGQDSLFFDSLGYQVTATDLNTEKLQTLGGRFQVMAVDLRSPLTFKDESYDVVYAHLSLHYFDTKTTEQIFADINRVLKSGGTLAFFVNSTSDPEFGAGEELETDYYEVDGTAKRFFTVESAQQFAHDFKPLLSDNNGETYKDSAKGVHNLIRFIGTKNT